MTNEKLVEKRQIIEWKDGCIYKTKSLGEYWVPFDTKMYEVYDGNIQYVTLSSKRQKELNWITTRIKK